MPSKLLTLVKAMKVYGDFIESCSGVARPHILQLMCPEKHQDNMCTMGTQQ